MEEQNEQFQSSCFSCNMNYYQQVKEQIAPFLIDLGFTETHVATFPESFGSTYSVFAKENLEVRMVWDGKDGICSFDFHDKLLNREWEEILACASLRNHDQMNIGKCMDSLKCEISKRVQFASD